MPKRLSYIQRASRTFLMGTHFSCPAEAVAAGARTLEEWVDTLNQMRQAEFFRQAEAPPRRQRQQPRLNSHPA